MASVTKAGLFLLWALKQAGKKYVLGSEVRLTPENFNNLEAFRECSSFDCSELAQAGLWAAGVTQVTDSRNRRTPIGAFDGAGFQWERSRSIGFEAGLKLPGALLFVASPDAYSKKPHNIGHVGISLGNGYVLEARGRAYGVTIGPVRSSFNLACKVQELYAPAVLE